MWGANVRDHYTVASHLSKLLHERGYRVRVTNYGEIAYVSTQEATALLRCLHRGEIPDIALFYDGISDVFSSYQNGAVGIPHNEWRRRAELALPDRPQGLLRTAVKENLWGLDRFLTGLRRRVRSPLDNRSRRVSPLSEELARQTLRAYRANLAFIESLGRRYGFEPLFYWQPTNIFSERLRPPEDAVVARRWLSVRETFDAIYGRVRRSEPLNTHPRFHDISTLFDDSQENYYVDGLYHLSETGNRLVAAAMVEDAIALIEQRHATDE